MTTAHTIERLTVRWGVVPDEQRRRAQQLQEALVDIALDDVLDGIGVASHEEVCVRDVVVPPYACRWTDTDAQLLDGWSRAIAAAIAASIDRADVVRYSSRHHAVIDLITSTLAGDTERAWAWAQLDLLPRDAAVATAGGWPPNGREQAEVLVRTLLARPHLVVGALVQSARRGVLAAAVHAFGSAGLAAVVDAAWTAGGGAMQRWAVGARPAPMGRNTLRESRPERVAQRVAMASSIWKTVVADAGIATSGDDLRAFAALAVLEAEPVFVASVGAPWLVEAIVATASAAAPPAVLGALMPVFGHERAQNQGEKDRAPVTSRGAEPAPDPEPARTAWGGLVFLVHLVVATGAVDRFVERADASGRALLWALGRALVDRAAVDDDPTVPDDDPALLAFCGLPPGAPVPETDGDVSTEAELVDAALRELIKPTGGDGDGGHEDPLRLVCHRDATVEAEPGWIDVVFALDDVCTDVRRAGLDLDPGYVPALGCVLRFRYA